MNIPKITLGLILTPLLLATHALGASLIWQTPVDVNIADDTQISNVGTFFAAGMAQATSPGNTLTVNNVTFTQFGVAPDVTISPSGGVVGYINSPATDYQTLIRTGVYTANGAPASILITGLTAGQTYQIQLWTTYWDNNSFKTRYSPNAPTQTSSGVYNATNETATLNLGGNGGTLPFPQFVLGTFVADSGGAQNLYMYGDSYGMLGAYSIRSVPEPTTVALFAFGGLALIVRCKFRRHDQIA